MKLFLVLAFAALSLGVKIDPVKYLKDFGYLPETQAYSGNAGDLNEAITNFQKFAHLPATGIIDDATVRMMHKPRCGVKDVMPGHFNKDVRRKRYVATSLYWGKRQLTYMYENYNVDLGRESTRRIIDLAWQIWSNTTNLSFTEVTGADASSATFKIRFEGGGHNCPYPFDGNGGTIAHAFYPHVGLIHFDEDEDFTDGENRGRNLLWVATHEFGHALGLPHSDVYEALMYPWYKGYKPDFSLPADDTGAIRALYGCKNMTTNPVPIPQDSAPYNGLLMERWLNAKGDRIHHIEPDVCIYPHQPNTARILQKFEAPSNSGDNFATRIRGYFVAEKQGYYWFYLCADHSAKLYLSTTGNPEDKKEIISVDRPTSKDFGKCKKNPSGAPMAAGQLYYIEAVHKDSTGDDFLKVGARQEKDQQITEITSQNTKWALIDTDISQIICKGRYETLICPHGTEVSITKASYGLSDRDSTKYARVQRICNFDWWSRMMVKRRDCVAKSSLYVVRAACHAKQQCTLRAHDSVFKDHCGDKVYSVLAVTYRCVANGTVTIPPATAAPTTQPTTTEKCGDKYPECGSWANAGYCSHDYIRDERCRMSCGVCVGPSTTAAPTTVPTTTAAPTTQATTTSAPTAATTPEKCGDKYPECGSWANAGYCSHDYIRNERCRMSCGVCVGPSTTAAPTTVRPSTTAAPTTVPTTTAAPTTQATTTSAPTAATTPEKCGDKYPGCGSWANGGYCSHDYIRNDYCRMSCGVCVGPSTKPAPTTVAPCVDRDRNSVCVPRAAAGHCKASKNMREYWCRKSCGTCV